MLLGLVVQAEGNWLSAMPWGALLTLLVVMFGANGLVWWVVRAKMGETFSTKVDAAKQTEELEAAIAQTGVQVCEQVERLVAETRDMERELKERYATVDTLNGLGSRVDAQLGEQRRGQEMLTGMFGRVQERADTASAKADDVATRLATFTAVMEERLKPLLDIREELREIRREVKALGSPPRS